MTVERRKEIFSKEYLSIEDVMELFDLQYNKAGMLIRKMRRCTKDRLNINGKIHMQDYLEFVNGSPDRYVIGGMEDALEG